MASGKSLFLGNTEVLVLKLLSEKDRYGYEIISELKRRSENVFEMKSGTLYPILHSLTQKGFLNSYEKTSFGTTRVFYGITEEGRKMLEEKKEDWKTYSSAINAILFSGVSV